MWRDASEPRTAAERLRAARRQETAALYEQTFERRRCRLSRDDAQPAKSATSTARTVGGETQPHDAGTPQPEVVAPLLSTASCDGASTAVSVPLVWALRANWGRCDPPRRRDWRMHGSGAHTAALARATTVRPASAAAASGAGGGMIKQQEPLWERPASALLTSGMSRARPHYASSCSSSTVTHKMTTAAPTTTTPTTAARAGAADVSRAAAKVPQLRGASSAHKSLRSGSGAIVMSKEEYQRLQQLLEMA